MINSEFSPELNNQSSPAEESIESYTKAPPGRRKQKIKALFGVAVFLVLMLGGVSAYLLSQGSLDVRQRASTGLPKVNFVPNSIPLTERPFVHLSPSAGREVFIELSPPRKPANQSQFEFTYDSSSGAQGAVGALEVPSPSSLATLKSILLGTKSAGGAVTFHDGVRGGKLRLLFSDANAQTPAYVLENEWSYVDNRTSAPLFKSRDEKFTITTNDLFNSSPYVMIFQNPGLPSNELPMQGMPNGGSRQMQVIAGPYSIAGVGALPSGNVVVKIETPVNKLGTVYGWNGGQWEPLLQTTLENGIAIASGRLMQTYIAVDSGLESVPVNPSPTPIPNPSPSPTPSPNAYSNLVGSINGTSNRAEFRFISRNSQAMHMIDLALDPSMKSARTAYASGPSSPIIETNANKWNEVTCGKQLYWRVRSADGRDQSGVSELRVICPNPFNGLSTLLDASRSTAQFRFVSILQPQTFIVDLSTNPQMATDVYVNFASGRGPVISESNPTKWDKFSCGRTLYWIVRTEDSRLKSPIQTARVNCAPTTPSPTPITFSDLRGFVEVQPNRQFQISGRITPTANVNLWRYEIATNSAFTGRVEQVSQAIPSASMSAGFSLSRPLSAASTFACRQQIYWRVTGTVQPGNRLIRSPVQSGTVLCTGGVKPVR